MKLKILAVVTIGLFMMVGCSQGNKYSDVEKLMEKQIDAQESLIDSLEKSSNADDAAKALTNFASDMEKLKPEMKKIDEKYGDVEDSESMPEELKVLMKKQMENSQKISQQMVKAMKDYSSEPIFQEATQKMKEMMQDM